MKEQLKKKYKIIYPVFDCIFSFAIFMFSFLALQDENVDLLN